MKCKRIRFQQKGDERGSLIVIESNKDIPFKINRVFYMVNTLNDVARGQHANIESDFVLVNVQGSVKIKINDGFKDEVYVLDNKDEGIYIPCMIWKEMYDFSEDAILIVFSNKHYKEEEYIRDFHEYRRIRNFGETS